QSCINCDSCNEICDTYLVSQNLHQSPNGRLKIAKKIFSNEKITNDEKFGLYTCTLCALCNIKCEQGIEISKIIHYSKIKLVEQKEAPYDVHRKIIKGIMENDNSVGGILDERLNWLPIHYRNTEIYEKNPSDTLLFLGCMSSFKVKESAYTSYEILKIGGFDFKILEHEPCCGEYIYSAGNLELAKKKFQENFKIFQKNGIKNIIVTCGGCLYAFNNVYPQYIEDWDIKIKHIIQIVYELEKNHKIKLNNLGKNITYHDACRLGRKLNNIDIYDEPRELLKKCGYFINELEANRLNSPCCGAGSGIRGVDSELCINTGFRVINRVKDKVIITSCPLCVFNFRYIDYKKKTDKTIQYITDVLLESIKNK
ncbi:MAG: (Fe-S)-binding protein, partial [Promethearchaeota archaeon]